MKSLRAQQHYILCCQQRSNPTCDKLRKPLSELERSSKKCKICVTGGTGYLGSFVVQRLLAAGHSVNVTYPPWRQNDTANTQYLKELEGADQRLQLFSANLLEEGSYDEAIEGCKYVIHMAASVTFNQKDPENSIIAPALKGVNNVLGSVNKHESVERVIMTSSIAAVIGDNQTQPLDESDWHNTLEPLQLPYNYAKTMSEKRAWEIAGKQYRWSLVVLNPGIVFGPVLNRKAAENGSMSLLTLYFQGVGWPLCNPMYSAFVDVEDVAQTHVLAMLNPEAKGRYILVSICTSLNEYLSSMKSEFPQYKYPFVMPPAWLIYYGVLFLEYLGFAQDLGVTPALVKGMGQPLEMDASKVQRELGLQYIDPYRTIRDAIRSLQKLQILER